MWKLLEQYRTQAFSTTMWILYYKNWSTVTGRWIRAGKVKYTIIKSCQSVSDAFLFKPSKLNP